MKSTLCTSEQFNHLWLFFREELAIDMYILGRVARAGRTGTAHSLIGPDEISYVFDLHLFLGRPMKIVEPGVATVGRSRNIVTTSQQSCGKVMFLQVSVCSRGGMHGSSYVRPQPHMPPQPLTSSPSAYGWQVATTYPTGMLSSLIYPLFLNVFLYCMKWEPRYQITFSLTCLWWNWIHEFPVRRFQFLQRLWRFRYRWIVW